MIQVRGGRKNRQMLGEKFVCGFEWAEKKGISIWPEIISRTTPRHRETLHHNVWNFGNFQFMQFEKENVWKYFRNLINVHEETFESDKRVNIWCHWPALDGWVSPSWLWSCKSRVYFYFSTSFVLKLNELMFFCWISQKVFKLICVCKFFNCGFWKCWILTFWVL